MLASARAPVLFVGETLVDLMCHRPVSDWAQVDSFIPHCGGAPTNAAVVAARCGAVVAIGGGVGDDHWGHWLASRLLEERVDLRWWTQLAGGHTSVAFVAIDSQAVPEFLIYGEGITAAMEAFEPRLHDAVVTSAAVEFGSNTLVGERERKISRQVREFALAQGKPVIVDVNLRPCRWRSTEEAIDVVRSFCRDALLVKMSSDEALLLTGEQDPATAAECICSSLSTSLTVVTLGPEGALMRGGATADVPGVPAEVVDTTGAGDTVTGVLVAALAGSGFDPQIAAQALPLAVATASRSTEGYGALDGLPETITLGLANGAMLD